MLSNWKNIHGVMNMKNFCLSILCVFSLSTLSAFTTKTVGNSGNNSVPLAMQFDSNGNSLLIFVDYQTTNVLKAAYMSSSSNETFGSAKIIDSDSAANAQSKLAFDNNGNAIFVWTKLIQNGDDRTFEVYYTYRPAGDDSIFSSKILITQFQQFLNPRPQLTFDASNNAILILNDFEKNRILYLERPPGANTSFGNPSYIKNSDYVITTMQNQRQSLVTDSNGNSTLAWNTSSKGTRYTTKPNGLNTKFSALQSMIGTEASETTYANLTADTIGNTYAVWGSTTIIINPVTGDAYIPVQFSQKGPNTNLFNPSENYNLGVGGINVLFDLAVDTNLTTYLSMMNFNLPTEGDPALLFNALESSKLISESAFSSAKSVFSQVGIKNTVEVPFLLLNKVNRGVLIAYFIDLNSESNDDTVKYAEIRTAIKPGDTFETFGTTAIPQKGFATLQSRSMTSSRTFTESETLKNIPYFEDGPNTINFLVATNPVTGNFILAYMDQEANSFPIIYGPVF